MEDTLRGDVNNKDTKYVYGVLILFLMEDTLREVKNILLKVSYVVLILVLMEDTLREL